MTYELTLRAAVLVAGGAVVGALARWLLSALLNRGFPYGTLVANVAGSFVLGLLLFGLVARGAEHSDARLFLAIGLLGSFTTMSAFAYDTVAMLEARQFARAALNVLGNPALSILSVWLGRALALRVWP